MKKLYIITLFLSVFYSAQAQYVDPVKIPIYLSGNFGELRNNHFHSGIDIKTQGVINKSVYSIADGYVSRISISPGGYGKALYITHPSTNQVSVYGHLESFNDQIEKYIREEQYKQETYRINLLPDQSLFPVKAGDFVAYSGNTGSSGGPHVHFEIRDAVTEHVLDPLPFYKDKIKDVSPPDIRGIAVYPVDGEGAVNNSSNPLRQNITKNKKGVIQPLHTTITAWGKIGLGVKAYDRMSGTSNIYGVKIIKLYFNDKLIFTSDMGSFGFDQTRMLNTFVDFADWRNHKSFFMKSFVEPGNALPFYKTVNNGYINIDTEGIHQLKYELTDLYGNTTTYDFSITGKQQNIPQPKKGSLYMVWDQDNHYFSESFNLIVNKGNLYNNFMFTLSQTSSDKYFSDIYGVNAVPVPLDKNGELKIKLKNDTLVNKKQYGFVNLKGNHESWIGGTYNNGYLNSSIRELGMKIAIGSDTEPPVITPIKEEKWVAEQKIILRIVDAKSGVFSCKGTIDGKFALFENDIKSPQYTYHFDSSRLTRGTTHTLEFTATDACGNTTTYTSDFQY